MNGILREGSTGNGVMELQSVLRKLGFYGEAPDGIFGAETKKSVIEFQKWRGITADGIVGPETKKALQPFLLGFDTYTVRRGDTFDSIAQKYKTDPLLVAEANPLLKPEALIPGMRITVPFAYDAVTTDVGYTHEILAKNIRGLKARYPALAVGSAGSSVLGRNIYALRFGSGPNRSMYNAAHHALEWITSPVLMKFTEDCLKAHALGRPLDGFDMRKLWEFASVWLIPMVNPDGVDLVINGLSPNNPYYDRLIRWNSGSRDFSKVWQANIRGVDINHNYNAAWEESKQAEQELGITGPGPTRYSGPYPVSEPETRAMTGFTQSHSPRLVMAYHTQGRVIYWNFQNLAGPEAKAVGESLSHISGYALDEATGVASLAGYKDWFIQDFRSPGYTVEAGIGKNPLPISQFSQIYEENLGMLLYAATVVF